MFDSVSGVSKLLAAIPALWVTGRASMKDGELYEFREASVNGNPSKGWVDPGGGTHCGQSMWDERGRRIQFMWMGLTVAGSAHTSGHPKFRGSYSGTQTMAREIVLAPKGSPT